MLTRHPHPTKPAPRLRALRRLRGMSLVELLVTVTLTSIGVVGLVGALGRTLTTSVDSEDRTRAALLADDLAGQMWMNRSVNLPAATITTWQTIVADPTNGRGLPGIGAGGAAGGSVTVAGGVATITIEWKPSQRKATDPVSTFTTQVVLP